MSDHNAKDRSILGDTDGLEMFAWPDNLDGVVVHMSTSVHPRPLKWWRLWARYKRWRAARWAASWTVEYADEPSDRFSGE